HEPESVRSLYGARPGEESFANNCLLARRLAERGVRYIQLFDWGWDSHGTNESTSINKGFIDKCRSIDQPIAALISDLKQRGLLEDTLVVWGGEFGRTPMSERGNGRDHNPSGFTMWMAGGGVRGGQTIGATDELGFKATENRQHVQSIHASILHLLGIDNMELTYLHQGRPERPTINEGEFCEQLVTG
ncbi:MAG: DUF1501 domain-containing protein, partial [Planctomycetota bacterium]